MSPARVVVKTSERRLYLVLGNGETISYPVGVGKAGRAWTGVGYINGSLSGRRGRLPMTCAVKGRSLPDVIPGCCAQIRMGARL